MSSRALRLARGWLVGVLSTALAALSHAIAGGGTPTGLALVVGAVFGGMLGTFALSTRPSLPRLVIAVGVSQLAFHAAFSTLGEAAMTSGSHAHEVAAVLPSAAHAHPDTPYMWLSHAVAGLVTLVLLRSAEVSVWRLLAELARLAITPFRCPAVEPVVVERSRAPRVEARPVHLSSRILSLSIPRRGPPVPVAF